MARSLLLACVFFLSGCAPHSIVPSSLREPEAEARRPNCNPAVTLSRLSPKPQAELKDIDKVSGIATTEVKKTGISRWSDTGCTAAAEGVLVREAAHETEGFWTLDVRLERFEIDKGRAPSGRFLRVEVAPGTKAHDVTSANTLPEGTPVAFGGPILIDHDGDYLEVHPTETFRVLATAGEGPTPRAP
jgi:hypothetical protein